MKKNEEVESQFMINEHLYDGIEKSFSYIEDIEERVGRIEKILSTYLKRNTRSDIDRLEQRFKRLEMSMSDYRILSRNEDALIDMLDEPY